MEAEHALQEILQEIALTGLYRSGFFDNAAFYGGTCLRIFYGLDSFSDDLALFLFFLQGKCNALLFRKWKQRVKGRDWYDLEWYIKKGIPLNLDHFLVRARDSGDWVKDTLSPAQFEKLLQARINSVSFDRVKEDIARFIPDARVIDIWSTGYFKDLAEKIKFE